MTVSNERKGRRHNSLRFTIVTTAEQWVHACAVRSICFLDEHGAQAKWLFDGNDYQCTHVLAYDGDEPVGTAGSRTSPKLNGPRLEKNIATSAL
jgi:hypothetical protein